MQLNEPTRNPKAVFLWKIQMQLTLSSNKDGLVSLTDLYRQAVDAGLAEGKCDPRRWSGEEGEQFIAFIVENLHVRRTDIYKTSKARADRGGGTFAHKQPKVMEK